MRVPENTLDGQQWRIREVLGDFPVEDVWQLPGLTGSESDFDGLLTLLCATSPASEGPLAVRLLWTARDLLGRWFGLGEIAAAADGPPADSILHRVPADLRGSADDVRFARLPFTPLYLTDHEFAGEIANRTMHGVMHLAWLQRDERTWYPQMTVFVRPRGRFGRAYMAFIKPFRYAVVYPALERQLQRRWAERPRT